MRDDNPGFYGYDSESDPNQEGEVALAQDSLEKYEKENDSSDQVRYPSPSIRLSSMLVNIASRRIGEQMNNNEEAETEILWSRQQKNKKKTAKLLHHSRTSSCFQSF